MIISSTFFLTGCHTAIKGILNPTGSITYKEKHLFFDALFLMLIIVIPVFIMSVYFLIRYRAAGNYTSSGDRKISDYWPNWSHSAFLEVVLWGVSIIIVSILGVMAWTTSHKLDPYLPIQQDRKPMIIKTIALPWKWLFIYPEQNIATINYLEIAQGQQVEFIFTNDNVPMSAFFIPQLGSQMYTMAGMRTRLYLIAEKLGTYVGFDSQYNGKGFSDMRFNVKVVKPDELRHWFYKVKQSGEKLIPSVYQKLIQPSIKVPARCYVVVMPNLFSKTLMQYKKTTINNFQ
ncbi:cytochrome C oxidase subunit II [Coxiella endosymbiont of Amblyomma americanum]|nr:cytochrome C oxidase subunit II [Coxiella endosymbiont of Amblyomma americanum]